MTREEIKNLILRRAYAGVFGEAVDRHFNLYKLAEENGVDNDEADKAYQELKDDELIEFYGGGGFIKGSSRGLLRAEELKLADEALIEKQNKIRIKLLVALADIKDRSPVGTMVDWTTWISEAGVSEPEFQSNDKLLRDLGLVKGVTIRAYEITPEGMKKVRDYRRRKKRLEDFERLEKLEGVTEQQRGHRLEDLLADSAEWEDWEVTKRVRSQGQEHDIIINKGLHYFLISCKWEAEPVQGHVVELLESRVRSRFGLNGGLAISMSGFTDNCILEAKNKISSGMILLFGPEDARNICNNSVAFTTFVESKYDEAMQHRMMLIDGQVK